jgi:hypothetical protein
MSSAYFNPPINKYRCHEVGVLWIRCKRILWNNRAQTTSSIHLGLCFGDEERTPARRCSVLCDMWRQPAVHHCNRILSYSDDLVCLCTMGLLSKPHLAPSKMMKSEASYGWNRLREGDGFYCVSILNIVACLVLWHDMNLTHYVFYYFRILVRRDWVPVHTSVATGPVIAAPNDGQWSVWSIWEMRISRRNLSSRRKPTTVYFACHKCHLAWPDLTWPDLTWSRTHVA